MSLEGFEFQERDYRTKGIGINSIIPGGSEESKGTVMAVVPEIGKDGGRMREFQPEDRWGGAWMVVTQAHEFDDGAW
jgi:hypothetical protein